MKKNKLNLESFKVQSFVTSLKGSDAITGQFKGGHLPAEEATVILCTIVDNCETNSCPDTWVPLECTYCSDPYCTGDI